MEIDSIDGSTVAVLHLPVASSDSHKGVSGILLAFLGGWDVLFQLFEELDGFGVAEGKLVGDLLLLDPSHTGEHVEGGLPDWNHTFNYVPEDALVTWSGGQRALVGPSFIEVDLVHELFEVQVEAAIVLGTELNHESIVPLNLSLGVSDVHFLEVLFWHDLEEEAEDTSSELRVVVLSLVIQEMDDVHFEIEELSVDGVLTWGMEVELGTVEGCNWNMWVKQRDGLSFDAVEVLTLRLTFGNVEEEGVANLVELQLLLLLIDLLVVEVELLVLEILKDWHLGAQVDWGLLLAEVTWLRLIESLLHFLLDFRAEDKVDTRSLADVVSVVFGEVVLEVVHMVGLAAWSAFGGGPSLLLVVLADDLPVLLVVLVGILLEVDVLHSKLARLLFLFIRPLDLLRIES